MLENIFRIFLGIHIAAGFTAFFIAPVALIARKGGRTHRRWGKVYFWAMTIATLSSMVVAAHRPNLFLFLIGIFSFYFAFSGYRVLSRKHPEKGQRAAAFDWIVAALTLLASLAMIVWGASNFGKGVGLNPAMIVFGLIGAFSAGADIRKFLRPPTAPNYWYIDHMSGMVASYLAAVSAFAVVNLTFLPPLVRWLGPTAIGVPLLSLWIRSYAKKLRAGNKGDLIVVNEKPSIEIAS